MLFEIIQIKLDKNNNEYYVCVNKENNECWKYVSLWDKETHISGETLELDTSKCVWETKISMSGEHKGAKYETTLLNLNKKEWNFKKPDMLDKMRMIGENNKSKFYLCSIRNKGKFIDKKYVGIDENMWEATFIQKDTKLEVRKNITTLKQKEYYESFLKKEVYLWYEVKKNKLGAEYLSVEWKGVEQ